MKRIVSVGLLLVGTLVLPSSAHAASCTSDDVTVVVQFPDGRVQTGCAKNRPDSGYAALRQAGFAIAYTPDGAVCKLNAEPSKDPCRKLGDVYWTYYHAKPGGTWTYSTQGGGTYTPQPGTVEGWRYGRGVPPTVAPPAVAAPPKPTPEPAPKPTAKPTRKADGAKPSTARAPDARTSGSAAPGGTTGPSGGPTAGATTGTDPGANAGDLPTTVASEGSSGAPTDGAVAATDASSTTTSEQDGGGLSWVWGLVLLAVLGAAGGTVAVRRRA